jgi:hypothetical protein
MEVSNRDK